MTQPKFLSTTVAALLACGLAGCSELPGNKGQQGAVIGGASGAAVGAAVTKNRALGAVIGGAVGAAGGYVIGQNSNKITGKDKSSAETASKKSETAPATAQDVNKSTTADLNSDGYVTLDEVVAMKDAGLTESQMTERLKSTGQVFDLNEEQQRYLRERGISESLITQLPSLNTQQKKNDNRGVISRDPIRPL